MDARQGFIEGVNEQVTPASLGRLNFVKGPKDGRLKRADRVSVRASKGVGDGGPFQHRSVIVQPRREHRGQTAHEARRLQRGGRVSPTAVVREDLAAGISMNQRRDDGRFAHTWFPDDQERRPKSLARATHQSLGKAILGL